MTKLLDHPLTQLTLVRAREFLREPEAIFWAVFFPIVLSVGLGLAFRERPEPVLKIAATPELAEVLRSEAHLDVTALDAAAARDALRTGKVALAAERNPDGTVAFRFDDTNPEGRTARSLADRAIQRAAGRVDPVKTADDIAREPGARYIDFLVPGVVGIGIMSNAVWGLGFSIVDTRRRKLTKRLIATPMSRAHYLGSYLIWRIALFPIEVVIPIVFGALAFGVPVRGSWFLIGALCLLGSMMFSAIGILVGSRARTIEAVSGIMNLVIMPMWIVSGVFFSAQRFPDLAQPIIKVLPLTLLLDALRAVQLQGLSLPSVWFEVAVMTFWLVTTFTAGLRLFKWK
jgi:ABC-type polysaccharide/polyol phosphate export permease